MAFDRARTSLQSVEEKLRRLFNMAGTIGAEFAADIRPVVLAGNLGDPGLAAFRGRHWAWASAQLVTLANGCTGLRFGAESIVRGIWCTGNFGAAMAPISVHLLDPQTQAATPAVTLNTVAGTWVDQRTLTVDNVPLFSTAGNTLVAGVLGTLVDLNRICAFGQLQAYQLAHFGTGIHVPAGSAIVFNGNTITAGNTFHVGMYGEIF